MDWVKKDSSFLMMNNALSGSCSLADQEPHCWDPNFLDRFCAKFPFQTMKTVRLRLNLTQALVETPELSVRVVLLVRDPRGSLESRKHRSWCSGHPDCEDPARLCQDLESDYHAYQVLSTQFPGKYQLVKSGWVVREE